MSAITIRPAQPQDCLTLAVLAGQLGYESTPNDFARRLQETRASHQSDVLVAQAADGAILGWIGVYVFCPVTNDARVEISGLIVDENHRSLRVGEKLLGAAEEWARQRG